MGMDMQRDKIPPKPPKLGNYPAIVVADDIPKSRYYRDPLELLGERSFREPRVVPEEVVGTQIQEFFRGAGVLVTGGTGFLGKVLVEKLLRSCPHIRSVYLLIRTKKGKAASDRLEEIFQDRLFRRLKTEVPHFRSKVRVVPGDCSTTGLGLCPEDRAMLAETVGVIFHGAATVRFDEALRTAFAINVVGAKEMVAFAKEVRNLKSMVHISTAFANCNRLCVEEKFYVPPVSYGEVNRLLKENDDVEMDALLPKLLGDWPNTYTFTKALGEDVVAIEGKGLPVTVFRPAVVISTYREPVRGWTDNVYGPNGLVVGVGTGVLHTYLGNLDHVTDMVPVDMTVNALIAAAWKTSKSECQDVPIYNYTSSMQNPISWRYFTKINQKNGIYWPTIRAIWYYSMVPISNPLLYFIINFFVHTIPGLILDAVAISAGKKPMLTKMYRKLDKYADTMRYFATRVWTFKNERTQQLWRELSEDDQDEFCFDMAQMSWEYHSQAMLLGMRVYLLKDDIDTLPAARIKWKRLYYAHCTLKAVCVLLLMKFAWMVTTTAYNIIA